MSQLLVNRRAGLLAALAAAALAALAPARADAAQPPWSAGHPVVLGQVADAKVVDLGGSNERLYYATVDQNSQVLSMISHDGGATWAKEPGVRIDHVAFPNVVRLADGTWRMYFQSSDPASTGGTPAMTIQSASSPDGLTWTRDPGIRIDTSGLGHSLQDVASPGVVRLPDGTWLMVFVGAAPGRYTAPNAPPNNTVEFLFWATSPDGLTWTKQGLVRDSRNPTDLGVLDGPELVAWSDGSTRLYYWSASGIYHLVYTGHGFTTTPALDLAETSGFIPSDPTLAEVDGHWQLFYGIGPHGPTAEGIYQAAASAQSTVPTKTTRRAVKAKKVKAKKVKAKKKAKLPLCKAGHRSTKRHPCRRR